MTMGANKPHRSLMDCPTRQTTPSRIWRWLNLGSWVMVLVIIALAMFVGLLAGCSGPLKPTEYTIDNPPPALEGECWVLKRDDRWYDCRA